jgi:hypothetical protein
MIKIIMICIGGYLIYWGIEGFVLGEVSGISGIGATSKIMIDWNSHPFQYLAVIMLRIIGGGVFIHIGISKNNDDDGMN